MEHIAAADREAANAVNERNDYDIVEVKDFETAKYYGDRSCSESKLCYTQKESTWDSYSRNGLNKVYLCLLHGWEDVPEVATEGNPYDTYGTSMIFVFIDPEGNISTSNCRWNHHVEGKYNGDVDHAFTKASLAETVGVPFDKVFRPRTRQELRDMGYIPFGEVQELLDDGMDPEELFNEVCYLNNGLAVVELHGKNNFLNERGKLLSSQWFDGVGFFYDGFAAVRLNGKCNFISTDGKFISNQWFEWVCNFEDGLAQVKLNGKWNFIDKEGHFLSKHRNGELYMEGTLYENGVSNYLYGKNDIKELSTNKNMKKNIVKINENTLKQIVAESVKRALNEGTFNNEVSQWSAAVDANYEKLRNLKGEVYANKENPSMCRQLLNDALELAFSYMNLCSTANSIIGGLMQNGGQEV